MPSKLGGQTGGLFASARQFFLAVQPACWKVYGNALGAASAYKQWSPRTFIVGREVRGQQFAAEDPDPIGTANRYADLVITTAGQNPAIDAWEFYNEPVINVSINGAFNLDASIDAAKKLNIAQMTFSSRLHGAGLKVVAYNLARGNPDYRLVPYLAGGAGASDYLGLHAYFAPRFENDPVNQALRYRQIMALLPAWARKPIIFTEYGTDFNGGGFRLEANHMTPDDFVTSCKAWDAALMADKFVAGSCGFVFGADSGRWETFEMSNDDVLPQLTETMKNSVPVSDASVGEPIPPDDPPTGGSMTTAEKRSADGFNAAHVAYNKDAALFKYAQAHDLGYPVTNEYNATYDGATWVMQCYSKAIVGCVVGDYANVRAFDWLTGLVFVPSGPTPPAIDVPALAAQLTPILKQTFALKGEGGGPVALPYHFPQVLTDAGAVGEEGTPVPGQPFYRLSGASVQLGVSAFVIVTVIGKNGVPKIGQKVVRLFPDGNGEVLETDGSGTISFQNAESSAFTQPGTGPFTIFIPDDSAYKDSDSIPKRIVFKARLSDIVKSLGDFQGQHAREVIQYIEQP